MRLSALLPLALIGTALAADPAVALVDSVVAKLTSMNGHISQLTLEAKADVAQHFIMGSQDLLAVLSAGASSAASVAAAADAAGAKASLAALASGSKKTVDLLIAKKSIIASAGFTKEISSGVGVLRTSAASFFAAVAPRLAVAGGDVAAAQSATLGAIDAAIAAFA
jgi:hypothetical protein